MYEKSSQLLEVFGSKKYFYPLAFALCYSATLYSFLNPVLTAYKRGDFLVSTGYGTFFIVFLFAGYLLRPKHKQIKPPSKGVFQGVCRPNKDEAWLRSNETNRLCDTIERTIGKPIILVGSSGVGKSVLLETQVVPRLEEDWKIISFSNYDTFKAELLEKLTKSKMFPKLSYNRLLEDGTMDKIDSNIKLLLIFDQFEQFFSTNSGNIGESKKEREWFKAFIENSKKFDNIRILIVVRKEWYYDLRFLAEFVPPPIESFHLSGLKIDKNESDKLMIDGRIQEVTKNKDTAEAVLQSLKRDGEILPVEVQMVGLMLENKIRKIGEIDSTYYIKELGGKDGLIQSYFSAYLDSSPNRNTSLKVLFALSVDTVLRGKHKLSHIANVVHETQTDVNECLLFLQEHGIVSKTRIGRYELAHDYLAERFHEYSGTELDPVERDNITFFWDELRRSSELKNITRIQNGTKRKLVFSDYFMIFLGILLLSRLACPIYGVDWGWLNPLNKYRPETIGMDIYYLPVFISHLAWSIYVTFFYRNFLSHLNESLFESLFSKFTVVCCTACVVTAAFLPYVWLISIAIGGLPIGWKFYRLSRTVDLPKVSINFFWKNGIATIINMLIALGLGIGFFCHIHTATLSYPLLERFNAISILVAIVMTYFMVLVTPDHLTRIAASKMIGLIDRGKVRLKHF